MIIVLDGGDRLAREHAAYILTGWAVNELGVADADVRADPPTDAALEYQTVDASGLTEANAAAIARVVGTLLRPGVAYGGVWPHGGLDLPTVLSIVNPPVTPAAEPDPTQEGGADHGL